MIVKEFYQVRKDGVKLFVTYSDENFKIQKVGTFEIYDKAIDIEDACFDYNETTEKIEVVEVDTNTETAEEEDNSALSEQDILAMLEEVF